MSTDQQQYDMAKKIVSILLDKGIINEEDDLGTFFRTMDAAFSIINAVKGAEE